MKKICQFVLGVVVCIIFVSNAYAAPAPKLMAVNDKTKECGLFFAGDEFSHVEVPANWKVYSPNIMLLDDADAKKECELKSYKYISDIFTEQKNGHYLWIGTVLGAITLIVIILLFISKRNKKLGKI